MAYIDDKRMALTYLSEKLDGGVRLALLKQKNRFSSLCSKLEALNPLGVLLRGYAVVFDEQGSALSGIGQIECGSNVFVRLSDGTFEATVIKKGE